MSSNLNNKFFDNSIVSKNWKFILISIVLFPVILLIAATLQPKVFFNKDSIYYLLSFNIFFIHIVIFVLLVLVFVSWFGKVPLIDLGINRNNLKTALWLIPVVWISEQVILVLISLFSNDDFTLNEIWKNQYSTVKALSSFFANTIATGLNEETFFRGFLFAQLYFYIENKSNTNTNRLKSFILSATISSLIFALCHLQFNLGAIFFLTIGGLVGASIFYLTNNLFYGIILHGFFNSPLPILNCTESKAKLIIIFIIITIVAIDITRKKQRLTNTRIISQNSTKY